MYERFLFLDALNIPDPAKRAAFLDRVCRRKLDLRGRVDALLAAHDAESYLREALDCRRKHLPKEDWRIGSAYSLLGDVLARQNRFAESEPLPVSGNDLMK